MNNRLENTLKQKLLKRDSLFYTGITEIKQYKPISVNCAALSKEGETFSKSIGHCLKTLMICINKERIANANNICQSHCCDFDPS